MCRLLRWLRRLLRRERKHRRPHQAPDAAPLRLGCSVQFLSGSPTTPPLMLLRDGVGRLQTWLLTDHCGPHARSTN